MADAFEDKLGDAIATELNDPARPWRAFFVAEGTVAARNYRAWHQQDAGAINTLKVSVIPQQLDRGPGSRGVRQLDYHVWIDLQKRLNFQDATWDAKFKELNTAAEQIFDFYNNGHHLTGLNGWQCLIANRDQLYFEEILYVESAYETQIECIVRGHRGG